jgi:hypothetical protein
MIEVLAALAGSAIMLAGMSATGFNKQNRENRDALIRLSTAYENLVGRLDVMGLEMKSKDHEIFARLNNLERAVAKLEGHADRN